MRLKFNTTKGLIAIALVLALLMAGCRTFRLIRETTDYVTKSKLSLDFFLTLPFEHGMSLADFQRELPTVRPTRMLFQPSRLRAEQDTLYQFDLPNESKIILYRSAKGQERFMAATIGTPSYPLIGKIRVGMPLDSLRARIEGLPDFAGDTLRLVREANPYEVDFYFKDGVIDRFQVLGRKRIP